VLSRDGGLLAKLLPFVKSGLAATFGDGRQFMSWVHIDDLTSLFVESLENHMLNGTYNAVSPNPVTNKVFLRALCKMLNRPLIMPGIPKFLLFMGLGEMANAIAGGNNVSCKKIMDTGFRFAFPELEPALRNLLNQ
jgi:hypothetical protein